jgi:hypothetical protein
MRHASLYIGLAITALPASFVTAAGRAVPNRASIVVVPSRFDKFLNPTGNVQVTFRDNHTELWTRGGGCSDPRVSPKGDVGWVRMKVVSVDPVNRRVAGNDVLDIRLLDGRVKHFTPLDDLPDARFIEEWRFADGGANVVIRSRSYHGPSFYVKYRIQNGRVIEDIGTYTPFSELPAWAKPIADQ